MNLTEKYLNTRAHTQSICSHLTIEDHVVQVAAFASPAKWHLAHTTWFFETFILKPFVSAYKEYHKDFNFLFNSYYNNAGDRVFRADRGNMTRPSVDEVNSYRAYVDDAMIQLISAELNEELKELLILGINHEQQHQELLLTDIKYMLGNNPLFPVYDAKTKITQEDINVNSDFEALVTNQEYIDFIEAGGYSDFNLWLDEGWSWLEANEVSAPLYWHKIKGEWFHFTLSGLQKVNPTEIVKHISFYEAAAFAEWKGMRLPTEFNSAYLPYPNFNKAEGAIGEYNGKFMINQMVLRGASVATSENHSRKTYRNFFHTSARWQYTGIRLVK